MISCIAHGLPLARAKGAPNLLGCEACSVFCWVSEGVLLLWIDNLGAAPMYPHAARARIAEAG